MSVWSLASELLFRTLRGVDRWAGLPKKAEATLHFRDAYASLLPERAAERPTLWIHGASVGELEDLASFFLSDEKLAEAGWRAEDLVLTASSVSARDRLERWRRERPFRYAGPLPPDRTRDIHRFLDRLNPVWLVLSHNDVWPGILEAFAARGRGERRIVWLPTRWPSPGFLKERLLRPLVARLGARSPEERDAARADGYDAEYVGYTRIDRILARLERARRDSRHPLEERDALPDPRRISVLLGSAWPEDAALWRDALARLSDDEAARFFVVAIPHEVEDPHVVASIQHRMPSLKLVVREGILLEAYRGFDLAYVGGGLGRGLHSVVEPVLWGLPTLCGPSLRAQPLAPRFIRQGALRTVSDAEALASILRKVALGGLREWRASAEAESRHLLGEGGATSRLGALLRKLPTLESSATP